MSSLSLSFRLSRSLSVCVCLCTLRDWNGDDVAGLHIQIEEEEEANFQLQEALLPPDPEHDNSLSLSYSRYVVEHTQKRTFATDVHKENREACYVQSTYVKRARPELFPRPFLFLPVTVVDISSSRRMGGILLCLSRALCFWCLSMERFFLFFSRRRDNHRPLSLSLLSAAGSLSADPPRGGDDRERELRTG